MDNDEPMEYQWIVAIANKLGASRQHCFSERLVALSLELFGGVAVVLTCSSHPTALMLILLATRSCCNVAPFHPLKVSKRPVTAVRQMGQAWSRLCSTRSAQEVQKA